LFSDPKLQLSGVTDDRNATLLLIVTKYESPCFAGSRDRIGNRQSALKSLHGHTKRTRLMVVEKPFATMSHAPPLIAIVVPLSLLAPFRQLLVSLMSSPRGKHFLHFGSQIVSV
jgi:hypothetical protein